MSFFSNFIKVFSGGVVLGILNLSFFLYITNSIGSIEIGKYSFLVAFIELSFMPFNFGFNQYLIKKPNDQFVTNTVFTLVSLQALIYVFIIPLVFFFLKDKFILASLQDIDYFNFGLQIISRIALLFTTFLYASHEANLEYSVINNARVISTLLSITFGFIFCNLSTFNYSVLSIKDFCSSFIFFWIIFFRRNISFSFLFSYKAIKRVISFSKKNLLLVIQERFIQRFDQLLIGATSGINVLGNYFVMKSFFEGIMNFIIQPIQTVLYAYALDAEFSKIVLYRARKALIPFLVLISALIFLLNYFEFEDYFSIIFGKKYIFSRTLFFSFFAYVIFNIFFEIVKVLAIASDLQIIPIKGRIIQLVFFLVTISLCLPVSINAEVVAILLSLSSFILFAFSFYHLFVKSF